MEINLNCICPHKNCSRHGKCSECREFHATKRKNHPPYCEKDAQKVEKSSHKRLRNSNEN